MVVCGPDFLKTSKKIPAVMKLERTRSKKWMVMRCLHRKLVPEHLVVLDSRMLRLECKLQTLSGVGSQITGRMRHRAITAMQNQRRQMQARIRLSVLGTISRMASRTMPFYGMKSDMN